MVQGKFSRSNEKTESPAGIYEEREAFSEVMYTGKFSWKNLIICSLKWTSQTPQGESAFEKIELSSNDDRGFHADGEDVNPLTSYTSMEEESGIQLLQVMESRWV